MSRADHKFEFAAREIADAAEKEATYHEDRVSFWRREYEDAVERVEETIGARVVRRPVTGGFEADVMIDYGDRASYQRMQQAFRKLATHLEEAADFRIDAHLYRTQEERPYELSLIDVHHYRIGMPERTQAQYDERTAEADELVPGAAS